MELKQTRSARFSLGKIPSKYLILTFLSYAASDKEDAASFAWSISNNFRKLMIENRIALDTIFADWCSDVI